MNLFCTPLLYISLILINIMEKDEIIVKVWKNRSNNQKLVTIPTSSDIEEGDYVLIKKVGKI